MATINDWNNQVLAANVLFQGGTMNIGNDSTTYAINIGTAASSGRVITVGNATGTSGIVLTSASGNIAMNSGFSITSGGVELNTLQPMFCAYIAADKGNVTGDGTVYTIPFDTTAINHGTVYNTTSHLFTAPITGNYLLMAPIQISGGTAAHTSGSVSIGENNAQNQCIFNPYYCEVVSPLTYVGMYAATINNMTASDTASLSVTVSGGTKIITVKGTVSYTCFMGFLIC
jgi:C1q domain